MATLSPPIIAFQVVHPFCSSFNCLKHWVNASTTFKPHAQDMINARDVLHWQSKEHLLVYINDTLLPNKFSGIIETTKMKPIDHWCLMAHHFDQAANTLETKGELLWMPSVYLAIMFFRYSLPPKLSQGPQRWPATARPKQECDIRKNPSLRVL